MSTTSIDAGKLREWVDVLELRETEPQVWAWAAVRRVPAQVTQTGRTNLFSKVGIGARDAALLLRRQPLTLHNALRWRGHHLCLTSITERDFLHLAVDAALVEVADCVADADEGPGGRQFPGILTEKYRKWDQPEPQSENLLTYVLVTPKAITLQRGGLVTVNGTKYRVQTAYTLDPYRQEYEIYRREDL